MTTLRKTPQACGTWPSVITADKVASSTQGLSQLACTDQRLYWLARRPKRQGMQQIMGYDRARQTIEPISDEAISIRSRVHEYGGGDYWLGAEQIIYYVANNDQCIYRLHIPTAKAIRLTPLSVSGQPDFCRYAEGVETVDQRYVICVRERHLDHVVVNDLVAVATDGSEQVQVLASGQDFYSSPVLSTDGQRLAWLSWCHPHMPWSHCDLYQAELTATCQLKRIQKINADIAIQESIYQPAFAADGNVYFVSDRSGWWQLYYYDQIRRSIYPVLKQKAQCELGYPQWVLGTHTWAFVDAHTIVAIATQQARQQLIRIQNGHYQVLAMEYDQIQPYVAVHDDQVYCIAANYRSLPALIAYDLTQAHATVIHRSGELAVDNSYFSQPESITFPSQAGEAHGFYYPPHHPHYIPLADEKPPLIVIAHGGPTACADTTLNLGIQYFTSRGFAVVEVNYRGSTGYGRAYRDALCEQWGVLDVVDCVSATEYLLTRGAVDKERLFIKGKSSGGLTVLAALVFYDAFKAGVSFYGVVDLESLLDDTHKFEAHYLDSLIGPAQDAQTLVRYQQRSPLRHAERLKVPVLFLQGLQDHVVPPTQAEAMMRVMDRHQVPYQYVTFEQEGHGFRQADSICKALQAELAFYQQLL